MIKKMKHTISSNSNRARNFFYRTYSRRLESKFSRARAILADTRGEGFVDTAIKILMAVVIGALVLAGLYALFSTTVLPTLTDRIKDMFNYKG